MYEPTKGSSYIPLPVALKSNKYAPVPKLPQADAGALLSTQIIRQLRRKWKDTSQVILHLILTGIKNMLVVVMAMKLCDIEIV